MLYRQAKVKRIQYNQTSFTTNAEGTSLDRKQEKEKVTYNGNLICLTADLSAETLQARREWQDIFKVLKGGKKFSTKITVSGKDLIQN